MSRPTVVVEDLVKRYGSVTALAGVSLEVRAGEIFGLLGPNGAGKTTLVKILATLARADSGRATVCDLEVKADPKSVRRLIGYVPQELAVDPYLTAREHLHYYADLYHLDREVRAERVAELLSLMNLAEDADRRLRQFSGGMKKKLELACGLMHRPRVLFLDEPSLGLDVATRRELWNYILRLRQGGATIFLCTHYMDEAERLCDQVAIIDRGSIAARGSPEALCAGLKQDLISIDMDGAAEKEQAKLPGFRDALASLQAVISAELEGSQLRLYVERKETVLPRIFELAQGLALPIESLSVSRPGLEEAFLRYTGHPFEGGDHHD